jgi:hypothetical protein
MAEALNISDIKLYNLVKAKFGEEEAEQFVALVKEEITNTVESKQQIIAHGIASLRDELYKNFASKADIAESKAEIIKWMFVFVFSSTILSIVSILAIVKFFIK